MVGNAVFLMKIDDLKDFMFRNDKFPGSGYPYNLFKTKIRVLIQITLCTNASIQIDLSKNKHNRFLVEEAMNYIPRTDIVLWVFVFLHASNFIMEIENDSIQRHIYDSHII